ncbi:hypothetical protein QFZ98_002789 [Paraburkholderia youngii]
MSRRSPSPQHGHPSRCSAGLRLAVVPQRFLKEGDKTRQLRWHVRIGQMHHMDGPGLRWPVGKKTNWPTRIQIFLQHYLGLKNHPQFGERGFAKREAAIYIAASWTAAKGGLPFFAYSTNCLIDLQAGIIVDVEATPANRSHEVESTRTMIERVEQRRDLKPRRLVGDTAYGSAAMLAWMIEEKEIAPHVPVWDKTTRKDNTLSSSEFLWDELANEYRCPTGHALRSDRRKFRNPRSRVTKADTIIYRASQLDCESCSMKDRCCPNTPFRKIARSIHEAARDEARRIAKTPEYKRSCRERKKVEMLFAHLKRILKLDRLRLRGPSGAHDEFLMAATAQNLRRMAKRLMPGSKQMNHAVA